MANVNYAQNIHAEAIGDLGASGSAKNEGTLKTEGQDYTVFIFTDSESVTEAVNKFLQDMNRQDAPPELLHDFEFVHITPQLSEVEHEIDQLLSHLAKQDKPPETNNEAKNTPLARNQSGAKHPAEGKYTRSDGQARAPSEVHSSIFSLARTFNTTLSHTRQQQKSDPRGQERTSGKEEGRSQIFAPSASMSERIKPQQNLYDRDREGKRERDRDEGSADERKDKKKKKGLAIGRVQAAKSTSQSGAHIRASQSSEAVSESHASPSEVLGGVENIYIRFMALMARILGQAELEAHQLYLRIKERTDSIDILTLLVSKINAEKGKIDWSKNEEMKQLVEKARAIGVEIPAGKLTWTEDEKKLFKENIQMRKDSMEKITQLERTDMQRFLQEASQCHQARSNVLKLMKEVMDNIIANMRGG